MPQLLATPVSDSFMDFANPDTNYGQSATIAQGVLIVGAQKSEARRAIVNFDVASIPAGAAIAQAKMQRLLTLTDSEGHSIRIARCTRPTQWTEQGVTWNTYDGVGAWITGGGEYSDGTPPAVSFAEAQQTGLHEVFGLGGFVRDALDNRGGIVSLILRNENEAPVESQRSAWVAGAFWKLIVDYDVSAEPGRRQARAQGSGRRPSMGRRPPAPSAGARPPSGRSAMKGGSR
jgi:hypothetical protein